jgi:hypothetical protein
VNQRNSRKLPFLNKDRLTKSGARGTCRAFAANTTPEKLVRSLLHRMGYRFRLHDALAPKLNGNATRDKLHQAALKETPMEKNPRLQF